MIEHVFFNDDLECRRCGMEKYQPVDTTDLRWTHGCRPNWASTWMNVAVEISKQSYDPRLRVGAIVVSEDNSALLGVGFNGSYRGGPHQPESTSPGMSGFIHAEANCLVKAQYHFPQKKHMYVTHSPCRACSKLIINAGISKVVYGELYRDSSGIAIMESVGIEVCSLEEAII